MTSTVTTTSNPLSALLKNKQLANPETWKKLQNLINLLAGMAPLLMLLAPQYAQFLTPEFIANLTVVVGSINVYLTTATTGKIGA